MKINLSKITAVRALSIILLAIIFASCSKPAHDVRSYPDGLERSTPEEQGVPSEVIADFFEKLDAGGYDVHGLMILRHNKVITEHWWTPYAPQYQHAMYSATKTFTGTAVGFAVQEGLLAVDDQVISFFPDLAPETISPELEALTVKHLLSMSVGHAPTRYAGSGLSQVRSFLAADFAYEPGTSFAYNITASHMLSHVITKVTGMSIHEYLQPRLLEPLGIEDVVWEMDNDGIPMGNGGTHMKTADLAKLGLFLLNKGSWNGEQLLNEEWIEDATTPHIFQNPEQTAEERANADNDGSQGYGYQIWMGRNNSYRAIGGNNQLAMVIPEYDLVIAAHSAIRNEAGFNSLIYEMLPHMSDQPLKADPEFDLQAKISKYEINPPFKQPSVQKVTMETRRYTLAENVSGYTTALFRFDASGNCYLTFESPGAIHNIPFGLDDWKLGISERALTFARTVYPNPMGVTPVNTAGMCTWTSENTLSAYYLSMFNPGSSEMFEFTFDDDDLTMEIVAPSSLPGPPGGNRPALKNVVVKGSRILD